MGFSGAQGEQKLVMSPGRASGALGGQWDLGKSSRMCPVCPIRAFLPLPPGRALLSFREKKAGFARENDVAEEGRWGETVDLERSGLMMSPVPCDAASGTAVSPTPPCFLHVLPTRLFPREDQPRQAAVALAKQPVFEEGKHRGAGIKGK